MATTATSAMALAPQTTMEDALALLPCSTIMEYKRGQLIYDQNRPARGIFLIIAGTVKVCRIADDGRQVIAGLYRADDFFGESALLGPAHPAEQAIAMENTKVMSWTAAEMEDLVARRPKLAVAVWQMLAQRSVDFGNRIESFTLDNVPRRLARCLVRLSERLGALDDTGSVQMGALTHELLSQYVGTSREGVTHHMNYFRKKGYLRYSRKGITLHRDGMREWLRQDGNQTAVA
jgi:CRP/FNR family transcriptional regulator, cyclic AMP receptor protein